MNNSIIPKRFWWIAAILILLPPAIGICYWIYYRQFPIIEWGAVSTWYVGLFSIWLLYRTLISQQKANNNNLLNQTLSELRENSLFLLKLYHAYVSVITGKFYQLTDSGVKIHNKLCNDAWFNAARVELSYIKNLLSQGSMPEDPEIALSIYKSTLPPENDDIDDFYDYEVNSSNQPTQELKDYFYSVFNQYCQTPSHWWNDSTHSQDEIDRMCVRLFVHNHPESISVINLITEIFNSILIKHKNYKSIDERSEFIFFAKIIVSTLTLNQRSFYKKFAQITPDFHHLLTELRIIL